MRPDFRVIEAYLRQKSLLEKARLLRRPVYRLWQNGKQGRGFQKMKLKK